ncbi:MAG: pirin family protein [Cyanobacteria bacterium P01_F01_bin.153]
MIQIRKGGDRGSANFGWLQSRHSFSFGHYYDPAHMGYGSLRVINEDQVQGGAGFDTHGHRDMEIITYVLSGSLEHKDTLGNGSILRPGDVQRMSAGTGILHSEFNASADDPVHFLQIWIQPNQRSLPPSYEERHFPRSERQGKLRLIASNNVSSDDGDNSSITVHQDVRLYAALLDAGETVDYSVDDSRQVWLQVAKGAIAIHTPDISEPLQLAAGDGAAIAIPGSTDRRLEIVSQDSDSEVLLFDLAA